MEVGAIVSKETDERKEGGREIERDPLVTGAQVL